AMARIAESSVMRFAHDLEVRILEARRVGPDPAQGRLDRLQRPVRSRAVERGPERAVARGGEPEARELETQARAVVGVDDEVLASQLGLERRRAAVGDDMPVVDNADLVGLLRLLEVMGGEEDRRAALSADRREVVPPRSASRRGAASG